MISGSEEENKVMKGRYKSAKREAKRIVTIAKNIAYEMLYQILKSKEGEKEVFRLARAREM